VRALFAAVLAAFAVALLLGVLVCSLAFALWLMLAGSLGSDDAQGVVTILFTYGSETQEWPVDVTRACVAGAARMLGSGVRTTRTMRPPLGTLSFRASFWVRSLAYA